jgi:LysM repeat protein
MKTTTYPTKHPHWIDEDDYAAPRRQRNGISFSTATVIVIAIHVAVIAGVYAYSNSKPKKVTPVIAEQAGPKSDSLAKNNWPEPEAQPKVVATPPPQKPVETPPMATPAPATNAVVKNAPKPAKLKNPAAPRVEAKPEAGTQEELRRQFLTAAGKLPPAIPKVQETPVARIQPQTASDAEVPAKKATTTTLAAEPASEPSPARSTATHYTLAPGDNLYMVSRKLGVSYNELAKANGIRDPRQLRVGQTLKVPGGSAM